MHCVIGCLQDCKRYFGSDPFRAFGRLLEVLLRIVPEAALSLPLLLRSCPVSTLLALLGRFGVISRVHFFATCLQNSANLARIRIYRLQCEGSDCDLRHHRAI